MNVPFEVPGPHKNTSDGGDNWSRTGGNVGGWPSKAAACNTITGLALNQRLGTIISVLENDIPTEYWWRVGTRDEDLELYAPSANEPVYQLRNAPWVPGPWKVGENAIVGQKVFTPKADIANSESAPTQANAFWDLIYDSQAPGDYATNNALHNLSSLWDTRWQGHDNRITTVEDWITNHVPGEGEPGTPGRSAYQIAVDNGFVGTQLEWLASLVGPRGKDAYDHAVDNGFTGDLNAWLASLIGEDGKDAYQIAVDNGFVGTVTDWLESLKGKDGDGANLVFPEFTVTAGVNSVKVNENLTAEQLLEVVMRMLTRDRQPMGVSIAVNNTLHERGTTPTVTISGNVSVNDETGQITGRRVLRNGIAWQPFAGNSFSFQDTPTANATYRVEAIGSTDGLKAAEAGVTFDLMHFYGPANSRPNAAGARNLTGKHFLTQGNTGLILNTGTTDKNFYILTAPGERVQEVKDLKTNAVLTNAFVLVGTASVNNAAGVAVPGYELRELLQSVPFSSNHRLQITLVAV